MDPLIQFKSAMALSLVLFGLACFGFLPGAQAVSPTPDGLYVGANVAEGGSGALFSLTTGSNNTAIGAQTLFSLTDGVQNTAVGAQALKNNSGDRNTADGFQALVKNTTGSDNTATGWRALFQNTDGIDNTATGFNALRSNTFGVYNTAVGVAALESNTIGDANTGIGIQALQYSSTGSGNIAVGNSTGSNVTTANGVICIGNNGANFDETTWIGHVYGITTQNGTTAPVVVSADGQLGTVASSERFKKEIKPMSAVSESILALKPVTFCYKSDKTNAPQFGLVAEDVEKINADLVMRDKEGKVYSVRYDAVNAMLLNEFLKEHRTVQEQGATIVRLQKQIEALTAGLQKVSAQLEVGESGARTVLSKK